MNELRGILIALVLVFAISAVALGIAKLVFKIFPRYLGRLEETRSPATPSSTATTLAPSGATREAYDFSRPDLWPFFFS
jgi:hypothetical protein